MTPTRTTIGSENKYLEWWLSPLFPHRRAEVGHRYWHDSLSCFFLSKQFVIASRVLPFLSVTICRAVASESDKTCQSASLSLSLSAERQDTFESAAPLSDMAVPKAPQQQARWRRGAGDFTETYLQTKSLGDIPHEAPSGCRTYLPPSLPHQPLYL